MQGVVFGSRSRASMLLVLCACLSTACGGGGSDDENGGSVDVHDSPGAHDAGAQDATSMQSPAMVRCDGVQRNGAALVEHVRDFTARFKVGDAYTKTVMLFGGEPVDQPNTLTRAYIFGLDKVDAQMLAQKYPDFYLCSSPGGREASEHIHVFDLVPANCEIYNQIIAALRKYNQNVAAGGDRTSLRLEGSPLELESVVADATGQDVSNQVDGQEFHLITSVTQLSGESVLSFGTK